MKKTVEETLNALLSPHAGDVEAEVRSGARVGKRRYLDMSKLEEMDELKEKAEG